MRFSKDGEGSGDCKKTYAAWIFSNVVGGKRYSTLRGKTDKLEEAVNSELNVTRS